MFYCSAEIEEDLKCSYCWKKFIDVVKLVPECGESICGDCYAELKENAGGEFSCKACRGSHKMPAAGLPDCKSLSRILNKAKIEKTLSAEADALKSLVRSLEDQLKILHSFDERDHVDEHCDRLEARVTDEIGSLIKHLNEVESGLLKQIKEYRTLCLESLPTTPSSESLSQSDELYALNKEINVFSMKWNDYFNRIDLVASESEIRTAIKEAEGYAERMTTIESSMKKKSMGGNVMSFEAHHSFFGAHEPLKSIFRLSIQQPEVYVQSSSPRSLIGHSECIFRVLFLPNGQLASCSRDKTIGIWNTSNGTILKLSGHSSKVDCLAYLQNGWLASASRAGTIKLWDLEQRKVVRVLRWHVNSVVSMKQLANGLLASYSIDNTIQIWNPYLKKHNHLLSISGHGNTSLPIPLGVQSNDNLVTCSMDAKKREECVLRVWSPKDGRLVKSASTGLTSAWSLHVLSNDQVALGFQYGTIKVIDLEDSARSRPRAKAYEDDTVASLAQLANGNLVSCGRCVDRSIKVWSLPDLNLLQAIPTGHSDAITSMSISPNNELIATASSDKTIKLWSISTK